jgi:hypothetical protein
LALAVPLSRFTPRVGDGSAFYVRQHQIYGNIITQITLTKPIDATEFLAQIEKALQGNTRKTR